MPKKESPFKPSPSEQRDLKLLQQRVQRTHAELAQVAAERAILDDKIQGLVRALEEARRLFADRVGSVASANGITFGPGDQVQFDPAGMTFTRDGKPIVKQPMNGHSP